MNRAGVRVPLAPPTRRRRASWVSDHPASHHLGAGAPARQSVRCAVGLFVAFMRLCPASTRDLTSRVKHHLEHLISSVREDLVPLGRLMEGETVGEDVVTEIEFALFQLLAHRLKRLLFDENLLLLPQ